MSPPPDRRTVRTRTAGVVAAAALPSRSLAATPAEGADQKLKVLVAG